MSRKPFVIGAVAVTLIGLSACTPRTGAAAYVGDDRITVEQVQTDSLEVIAAAAKVSETALDATEVNRRQVNQLVTDRLITTLAERRGIVVSEAEVDALVRQAIGTSDRATFANQLAVSQLVPPSRLESFARTVALNQKVSAEIGPGLAPAAQTTLIIKALGDLSVELGTGVSQRYGTWNAQDLTVALPPNDLSVPAVPVQVTSGTVETQ